MAKKKTIQSVATQSGDIAVQASPGVTESGSSTEGNTLSSEIARLTQAKADIKAAIEAKGVTVGNGTIDTYARKIGEISSGESVNRIDLSKGYVLSYSTFSEIDAELYVSNAASFASANELFRDCTNLISVSLFDTSRVQTMHSMFYECKSLTSVPLFDTSNVKSMRYMFYYCKSLTSIPQFDTSRVTDMYGICTFCNSLVSIAELDVSKVTTDFTFSQCDNLTTLGGFTGLKTNLNLSSSPKLTHDSIMNVINKAGTVSSKTITIGAAHLAKLTDEEKAVATNKGWTLK